MWNIDICFPNPINIRLIERIVCHFFFVRQFSVCAPICSQRRCTSDETLNHPEWYNFYIRKNTNMKRIYFKTRNTFCRDANDLSMLLLLPQLLLRRSIALFSLRSSFFLLLIRKLNLSVPHASVIVFVCVCSLVQRTFALLSLCQATLAKSYTSKRYLSNFYAYQINSQNFIINLLAALLCDRPFGCISHWSHGEKIGSEPPTMLWVASALYFSNSVRVRHAFHRRGIDAYHARRACITQFELSRETRYHYVQLCANE